LDLQKLSVILPDAKYNPEEAPALVMQFIKPRSVVTLFPDGMVTLTGPKSMDEIEEIIKMVRGRLLIVGIPSEEKPEIKVQNTTVSTDLGGALDLKALAKSLQNATYHAKEFPGLVYRTDDPNTVILLFNSGKIVCNGVTWEEMRPSLDAFMEKLISLGIRKEENVCQK
jgi:transcription initiation factor TFIID TATA-box-binding protein